MDDVHADGGFMDKKRNDAGVTERGCIRRWNRITAVEYHFGVNESAIRFITKNEDKYRGGPNLVFHWVRNFLV